MKTEIQIPTTPNFLRVNIGQKEVATVPIKDFSKEELEEVGRKWTADLLAKHGRSTNGFRHN